MGCVRSAVTVASVLVLTIAGCSDGESEDSPSQPDETAAEPIEEQTSPSEPDPPPNREPTTPTSTPTSTPENEGSPRPRVTGVVATGLEVPWGIAFLPDDSALVAERIDGTISRITPSGRVREIGTVPGVNPIGEGGLLGLAVSPRYARDHRIFAYLTTDQDNRVVSMRYAGGRLGPPREVLTGIPFGSNHNGGRLAFGPDGKLYVSTGEAGVRGLSQDPGSLGGKILRINPNGSIPADNPDPGSPIWTSGHRNVQGLAFDDADRLWASEFGDDLWDELNLIRKGRNYGWPRTEGRSNLRRFTDPLAQWNPDNASPSGLAYADGSLWGAALEGERLWRVPVRKGGSVGTPKAFLNGRYGRLRTAVVAPDGSLWLATSNRDGRGLPRPQDDRIIRVVLR
ncbi:MAG: PQQ-dependent sugar dehydrogenase [Propionibacteriales bacterium]|nr:PQQ-dependent sugar dehydrogenase [Propionibacteriales bacterium]